MAQSSKCLDANDRAANATATALSKAAGKAAYLEKYKAQMAAFAKEVSALEAAVTAGDTAAAKASFDKLNEMKKKGHEDFKKD